MSLRPLSTYPSLVASFFPFHPTTTTPLSQLFDATCTTTLGRLKFVPMFLVSVDLSWSRSMSRAQARPTFHVFLTISDRFRYTISARCYDVQWHGSCLPALRIPHFTFASCSAHYVCHVFSPTTPYLSNPFAYLFPTSTFTPHKSCLGHILSRVP